MPQTSSVESANAGVGKGKGAMVKKIDTTTPSKNNNPYTMPFSAKCYRYDKVRHCSNECPKRKAVNVIERDYDIIDNEVCGTNGDETV